MSVYRIWPAVLRQATYGTIKFGTYYTLKEFASQRGFLIDEDGDERVWCNILCAVISNFPFIHIVDQFAEFKMRILFHDFSWCNFKCSSNTDRCLKGSNASSWPGNGSNGFDWLLPRNLPIWGNIWLVASKLLNEVRSWSLWNVFLNRLQGLVPTAQRGNNSQFVWQK